MRICPGRSTDSKTDPWICTHVAERCGGCGSRLDSSAQSNNPGEIGEVQAKVQHKIQMGANLGNSVANERVSEL